MNEKHFFEKLMKIAVLYLLFNSDTANQNKKKILCMFKIYINKQCDLIFMAIILVSSALHVISPNC